MKKTALFICSVVMLLAVITPQYVMAQNTIKSVKYLNHKYKGEVNSNKTPDGEGELEMFGVKGLVKGFFQGNYVKNATVDAGSIKYTGDLTFDKSNEITLKAGGTFTYFYCLDNYSKRSEFEGISSLGVGSWESQAEESFGSFSFSEQLNDDKKVNEDAFFSVMEKEITYPFKLKGFDYYDWLGVPTVPVPAKLELRKHTYTTRTTFLGSPMEVQTNKYVFVLDYESVIGKGLKDAKGFKDNQGRIWDFYGPGLYKVTYPDGCYYAKTGGFDSKWAINKPNVGIVEFDSNKSHFLTVKLKDNITIYNKEDNFKYNVGGKFEELLKSRDFSKNLYVSEAWCIIFNDLTPETLPEKEVERLIREKIVPVLGEMKYTVVSADSNSKVLGEFGKFDKDGFNCHDCDYSYLSESNIEKKQNASIAKSKAESARNKRAYIAQFKKKYGFDPSTISYKNVIAPGRSWNALVAWNEWCGSYGVVFQEIFVKLISNSGSSKYYSFGIGEYKGYFWINNGRISSIIWR